MALIAAFNIFQHIQSHPELQAIQNKLLLLNALVVVSLSILIYMAHVAIYQTRRSRWLGIIRKANIDYLTGLPNQYKLLKDLKQSEHTNLAFLKFHNYNSILNTYGPAITDGVVKQVAAVLASFTHPLMKKSSCYYIQQAVFAILEDQESDYEQIAIITKAIVKKIMSTQYQVGENEYIALNITIGAVRQNEDAFTLANMALQEAEAKKLQFYLIDQHESMLPETYKRDLALTQSLLVGIQQRRVVPFFQPIFSAQDRSVKKYECLARMLDENHEVAMMPNVFMPLAHRANLYYLITRIMVSQAVKFAKKNQVMVTINISMTDINNRRTNDYIFNKVKNSGIGHLIQFELLENEAILEPDAIVSFINKMHELGCEVGMDDLGKGYSNIERLINLPIDFVKIDRSIMENVSHNLEMQNVARGIVKLAHKKGLQVVAEFCADATITGLAIDLGVDFLQGHYLGKPSPDVVQAPKQAVNASL